MGTHWYIYILYHVIACWLLLIVKNLRHYEREYLSIYPSIIYPPSSNLSSMCQTFFIYLSYIVCLYQIDIYKVSSNLINLSFFIHISCISDYHLSCIPHPHMLSIIYLLSTVHVIIYLLLIIYLYCIIVFVRHLFIRISHPPFDMLIYLSRLFSPIIHFELFKFYCVLNKF